MPKHNSDLFKIHAKVDQFCGKGVSDGMGRFADSLEYLVPQRAVIHIYDGGACFVYLRKAIDNDGREGGNSLAASLAIEDNLFPVNVNIRPRQTTSLGNSATS